MHLRFAIDIQENELRKVLVSDTAVEAVLGVAKGSYQRLAEPARFVAWLEGGLVHLLVWNPNVLVKKNNTQPLEAVEPSSQVIVALQPAITFMQEPFAKPE